jgi:hypothetical protein
MNANGFFQPRQLAWVESSAPMPQQARRLGLASPAQI